MNYPSGDDDPVIWQCSQAVELKRIFADAPVPTAPPPSKSVSGSSTTTVTETGPHGVKRKRRHEPDTPATASVETLGLIQQLSRELGGRPSNSNRRTKRVASAGDINLGMPPPKPRPRPPSSDKAWTSDNTRFNRSRSSTTSPLIIGKSIAESSPDSVLTVIPSTPPKKTLLRPATEPTIPVSALLDHARAESPELPPPPAPPKPVITIRTDPDTVNKSAFCSRSNTLESATSTTGGSFISTTAPISPTTPLVALPSRPETPETPILDLTEISPTPSPEPKIVHKTPPRAKSPLDKALPSKPPTQASRPVPGAARATTDPNPPKRLPSLQHTRSEPPQPFKTPTQAAFKPPTQQAFKPPTQTASRLSPIIRPTQQQQNPRTFPSSQSRLGMGALGKGYSGVNKPFKVPNKGKGTVPLSVVPLPRRDSVGAIKAPASPSKKKENFEAGRGKRGNSPAPAARPTTRATNGFSSRTTSGSSSRTSASSTRTPPSRMTTGKHTQSRRASDSKRNQTSDDSCNGSDSSYDAAAVDADMAFWDTWND